MQREHKNKYGFVLSSKSTQQQTLEGEQEAVSFRKDVSFLLQDLENSVKCMLSQSQSCLRVLLFVGSGVK